MVYYMFPRKFLVGRIVLVIVNMLCISACVVKDNIQGKVMLVTSGETEVPGY